MKSVELKIRDKTVCLVPPGLSSELVGKILSYAVVGVLVDELKRLGEGAYNKVFIGFELNVL